MGFIIYGKRIIFHGATKLEFRENLVQSSDVVVVFGGSEGTLRETMLALYAGKPVYVMKNYGVIGEYMSRYRKSSRFLNLNLVDSLPELIERLNPLHQAK